MSLQILKPGLLDTIQDRGRFGFRHWGINTTGVMDYAAMAIANCLVGNEPGEAVLEMHFPPPEIRMEATTCLALAGADFSARADGVHMDIHKPVIVRKGVELKFQKINSGARCYLAIRGGFALKPWLGSNSTNRAAATGGWQGRALQAGDILPFRENFNYDTLLEGKKILQLPWSANVADFYPNQMPIRFIPGIEFDWLTKASQKEMEAVTWKIDDRSDRMGCFLNGPRLQQKEKKELISSAVTYGTIQLLPGGQPIVLMADCQTTGGYPRIGQVIHADLPRLAQMRTGQSFQLQQVTLDAAFSALRKQQQALRQLQIGCMFKTL